MTETTEDLVKWLERAAEILQGTEMFGEDAEDAEVEFYKTKSKARDGCIQAAALLTTQAAEIERLREALTNIRDYSAPPGAPTRFSADEDMQRTAWQALKDTP